MDAIGKDADSEIFSCFSSQRRRKRKEKNKANK